MRIVILVVSLALAGCGRPAANRSTPIKPTAPKVLTLKQKMVAADTRESFIQAQAFSRANTPRGLAQMGSRLFFLPEGTEFTYLETDIAIEASQIKITNGEHAGKTGWITGVWNH